MFRSTLILLLALAASPMAFAQTACPSGVAPGSPQCGSDSGTSRGAAPAAPRYTGEWIKTWGSIAGSDALGESGSALGKLSEQEANETAIRLCAAGGAKDCKVNLSFYNQCAVLVSGPERSYTQGSASIERATGLAMKACEKSNGGQSCKLLWSGCSDPIFRKY